MELLFSQEIQRENHLNWYSTVLSLDYALLVKAHSLRPKFKSSLDLCLNKIVSKTTNRTPQNLP